MFLLMFSFPSRTKHMKVGRGIATSSTQSVSKCNISRDVVFLPDIEMLHNYNREKRLGN